MPTKTIRSFIAIDLPLDLKKFLGTIQADLNNHNVPLRWVKEKNLHITLKFLNQIDKAGIKLVQNTLSSLGEITSPFRITLSGFTFSPNEKNPRIFFVNILDNPKLKYLAQSLDNNLTSLGIQKDNNFKSHITLARIKDLKNISSLTREVRKKKITQTFLAKEIILYASTLTDSGPVYEKIFKTNLAI